MNETTAARTFCFLKPDTVQRNLVGDIASVLGSHGRIIDIRMVQPTPQQVESHYIEHRDRPYFAELLAFTLSGRLVPLVLESCDPAEPADAFIGRIRRLIGDYSKPTVGTIRHRFRLASMPAYCNLIHGSDSPIAAVREAAIWLGDLTEYETPR